ncbi:MAG: glycosyltransferase family 2 protein [Planctomycetota bacterium]
MNSAAIVFFIFNRPDTTRRVFERIAACRPERLLVVADAPRPGRSGEEQLCAEARSVTEHIDWPCHVERDYAAHNLGCRERIATGVTWAFEQVEEAIFLEDDCLPEPSFFPYATELLARYRQDERIAAISGNTFLPEQPACDESYYYSRYFYCWGWASWRRAWTHYDPDLADWPARKKSGLLEAVFEGDAEAVSYWARIFDGVHEKRINTWDYQVLFTNWKAGRLTILPRFNLVSNIGFRSDATHTLEATDPLANLPTKPLVGPLVHPARVLRHVGADAWSQRHVYQSVGRRPRNRRGFRRVVDNTVRWFRRQF